MTFRNSQIRLVVDALEYLDLKIGEVNLSHSELLERLKDYTIPDARQLELITDGSIQKPTMRNVVKSKPISKNRFCAMMKQVHSLEIIRDC